MNQFVKLQTATTNSKSLENYLANNFQEIYDFFFQTKQEELVKLKDEINKYILLNRSLLTKLDGSIQTNISFLILLLEVSERLGLESAFKFLFEFLKSKNLSISKRILSASEYLVNIQNFQDYLDRYDSIIRHLQIAFETEEDNSDKVNATLIGFYSSAVYNFGEFNQNSVNTLRQKITSTTKDANFSFLNISFIEEILGIDISNFELAHQSIHQKIDSFLGRELQNKVSKNEFLIEIGTNYAEVLEGCILNFNSIRQISVNEYRKIASDSIYNSLQRGVGILQQENQLFSYMNSFGKMHFAKLFDAIHDLPSVFFQKPIEIIDWGCGQGVASMIYLEFLNDKSIEQSIDKITLIEPSEIALKRAALHLKKFNNSLELETIQKDLDSLLKTDFYSKKSNIKLHFFSNILDIDLFLLTQLIDLVSSSFHGENYFVCVSPYINDLKTNRLDIFMNHFSKKDNFEKITVVNNRKDEWTNNWTRVVRIFKANI